MIKKLPWLRKLKKTDPEPPVQLPIACDAMSNGEGWWPDTPRKQLIRKLVLEKAEEVSRREGIDRREYLERKFGGPARASQIYERVRRAGTQAGIAFDFERIERQPNTRDAHRLIAWAQSQGDAEALVERLFRAYFVEGRFVGAHEVLAEVAHEAGLSADDAYAFLSSGVGVQEIADAEERAASLGISGVPFFIVDGRYGLSGAQPAEAIVEALRRARQAEAAD